MDQTLDQIEDEIGRNFQRIESNLRELGGRVDAATDWRAYYQSTPYACLGAAAALAGMVGWLSAGRRDAPRPASAFTSPARPASKVGGQLLDTWDGVQYALIAVAAAKLTDYLGDLVPGFREHYQRHP